MGDRRQFFSLFRYKPWKSLIFSLKAMGIYWFSFSNNLWPWDLMYHFKRFKKMHIGASGKLPQSHGEVAQTRNMLTQAKLNKIKYLGV